jgi:hypothetical protein
MNNEIYFKFHETGVVEVNILFSKKMYVCTVPPSQPPQFLMLQD